MNRCHIISSRLPGFAVLAVFGSLFLYGCGQQVAGGGAEDGNTPVAGIIKDADGPAARVLVTLYPGNFNPAEDPDSLLLHDTTGTAGRYRFKVTRAGVYNIQARHVENGSAAMILGLEVPSPDGPEIAVPNKRLKPTGSVALPITDLGATKDGTCYIPGSNISVTITAANVENGSAVLTGVPSANYTEIYYAGPGASAPFNILQDTVKVSPGDTAVVGPFTAWSGRAKVIVNTSPSGADVNEDVARFPLLIRLNSSNAGQVFANARPDGSDIRFTKSDGHTILPFEIERWDSDSARAEIWIRMDTVYGGSAGQAFFMYWGHEDAAGSGSGEEVFDASEGFYSVHHLAEAAADTGTEGLYKDATANHIDGDDHVLASGKTGLIASGQEFSPQSDYIHLGTGDPSDSALTLSLWVDWRAHPLLFQGLICKRSGWQEDLIRWGWYRRPDSPWVTFGAADGNNADFDYDIPPEQWVHLALTWTADGNIARFYVNGVQQGGGQITGLGTMTDAPLLIGATETGKEWFGGFMDEVRISSVVRSPAWLKLCYESQKAGAGMVTIE